MKKGREERKRKLRKRGGDDEGGITGRNCKTHRKFCILILYDQDKIVVEKWKRGRE